MKPLSELKHLLPENPPGTAEGHYWTMNNMGTCEDFLDELTRAFVDFSGNVFSAIDIGCGYGTAALEAKKAGCEYVCAIDIYEGHINVLKERAKAQGLKISTIKGDFLKELDFFGDFEDKSFDAALLNKVLHILTPSECMKLLEKTYNLLVKNGKIFIKASTPYLKALSEDASLRIILRSMASHRFPEGIFEWGLFPGYIDKIDIKGLPGHVNLFTEFSLSNILSKLGFEIEICKYIQSKIDSMRGDSGRDYVMAIARKL